MPAAKAADDEAEWRTAHEATFDATADRHRVTVWLRLTDPGFENLREQQRLFALENRLMRGLDESGVGEHDSNSLEAGYLAVRLVGDDADAIVAVVRPLLATRRAARYLAVRSGPAGSGEERLEVGLGEDRGAAGARADDCDAGCRPGPARRQPPAARCGRGRRSLRRASRRAPAGAHPARRAVRVRDIVDHLNAEHLDWSFSRPVVVASAVQLQANWRSDYRTSDGILLQDGPAGPELLHRGQQPRGPLDRAPGRTPPGSLPGAAARLRHRRGRHSLTWRQAPEIAVASAGAPGRPLRASRWLAPRAPARGSSGRRRRSRPRGPPTAGHQRCHRA